MRGAEQTGEEEEPAERGAAWAGQTKHEASAGELTSCETSRAVQASAAASENNSLRLVGCAKHAGVSTFCNRCVTNAPWIIMLVPDGSCLKRSSHSTFGARVVWGKVCFC